MIVYPLDRLYEEMAYVSYHLHWTYGELMQMEHRERKRWVREVIAINTQLNSVPEEAQ